MIWPKRPVWWHVGRTFYVSVPFTWNLPAVRRILSQQSLFWDQAVVGGPAVQLMPDFLAGLNQVRVGGDLPGVLQRVNPLATRTTTGCIRHCKFCGIGRGLIEAGGLRELPEWPNGPILADNNLLAASIEHFDRVMNRLIGHWEWADFTQGIDARLLNEHHAYRLAMLRDQKTVIRLALDSMAHVYEWSRAFDLLRGAGVPLRHIRSYALVGFDSGPAEAWQRCEWVEKHKVKVLPMWFHPLDALAFNVVTPAQQALGWTDEERRRLFGWYYRHRGSKPLVVAA